MFRMCASNSHSYTHLILALGIVREPTIWGFITSQYPGIHDIGLPTMRTGRDATIGLTQGGADLGNSAIIAKCKPVYLIGLRP